MNGNFGNQVAARALVLNPTFALMDWSTSRARSCLRASKMIMPPRPPDDVKRFLEEGDSSPAHATGARLI